jgi:hypothetical protein
MNIREARHLLDTIQIVTVALKSIDQHVLTNEEEAVLP